MESGERAIDDEDRALPRRMRVADKLMALGRMTAGVAHEIGAPLNVILGQVERLEALDPTAPGHEARRRILEQVERIEQLLHRLSRFVSDREPELEEVDLRDVVKDAVELARLAALDSRVRLAIEVPGAPCVTRVARGEIHQALTNLLLNAIEATPPDGRVRAGCGRERDAILLWVEDSGSGMAPERVDALFEPFVTTKERGPHTGLGLAIVREVVDAHRGAIEVETAPGVGTCFRVRLPLRAQAAPGGTA